MNARDTGLELSKSDLYPPLLSDAIEMVSFSTTVPDTEALAFDYTVNGATGDFAGIVFFVNGNGGHLRIDRDFIAQYQGAWPVRLEVRAWRDEAVADSALLTLHDTRGMVVKRCEVTLVPNPIPVSADFETGSQVQAAFFDGQDLALPAGEISWEVLLPQPPQGVVLEGRKIRVFPDAQPGEVTVIVKEGSGLEQAATLLLVPQEGIGLELTAYDLYPPLLGTQSFIWIYTALEDESTLSFTYTINGEPFRQGVGIVKVRDSWGIWFERDFIHAFPGPWPAELQLFAHVDKVLVESTTLRLYDTREMVCAKVDFVFSPSDVVEIPQQGVNVAVAAPRLYDANGVLLPPEELEWDASLVEPVHGVSMSAHVVHVSPQARPGSFRVVMHGPNGLNRARVLTLV